MRDDDNERVARQLRLARGPTAEQVLAAAQKDAERLLLVAAGAGAIMFFLGLAVGLAL